MSAEEGRAGQSVEILDESVQFSFTQLCQMCRISPEMLQQMVAEGILQAQGSRPSRWVFASTSVTRARRACRLRHDLDLDYAALALALDLMEDRERLEREVHSLRTQLRSLLSN